MLQMRKRQSSLHVAHLVFLATVTGVLATACRQPYRAEDLVGKYQLLCDGKNGDVLTLHRDGTFVQQFGTISNAGRWEQLRGSVVLRDQQIMIGTPTFVAGHKIVGDLPIERTDAGPKLMYDENMGWAYVRVRSD